VRPPDLRPHGFHLNWFNNQGLWILKRCEGDTLTALVPRTTSAVAVKPRYW
jgi:hypothetical protein